MSDGGGAGLYGKVATQPGPHGKLVRLADVLAYAEVARAWGVSRGGE